MNNGNGNNGEFDFGLGGTDNHQQQTENGFEQGGRADNQQDFSQHNRFQQQSNFGPADEITQMLGNFNFTYRGLENLESTLADGKEALNAILSAMLKDKNIGKFKIIPIDRNDASLLYSSIVLAGKLNGSNKISYSVLILTKTGRAELSAKDILAATNRSINQNLRFDKRANESIAREIAFPIDTFDSVFHQATAEAKIRQEFGVTTETISYVNINVFDSDMEFFVETKEGKRPTREAIEYFRAMFNPIIYSDPTLAAEIAKTDFSLVPFIRTGTKISHEVNVGSNSRDGKNRSDISVSLKATFNNAGQSTLESINKQPLTREFIKTDLFVAPTFTKRSELDPTINRIVEVNRVQPVLVISDISTVENTLRFALGGIIAALPMMSDTMYPYGILKSKSNWGNLNVYEASDAANYANTIDLKSPEFTEEEVIQMIDGIVAKDRQGNSSAMLAIDISSNTKSYGLSVIRDAASEDRAVAEEAGRAIVNALHNMTGGIFPADFNPLEIFQTITVSPEGYFVNKTNGERIPVSTYDITSVIEAKVDPQMVYAYNLGEYNNLKLDAYMNKLDALDKIGVGSAVITGKTYRGFFSEAFIVTLEKSIKSVGLTIFVDKLVARTNIGKFEGLTGYNGLSYGYANTANNFHGGSNRFDVFNKGVAHRQY